MTVDEAKVFYPLFGLGANVALIFSGRAVKYFSQVLCPTSIVCGATVGFACSQGMHTGHGSPGVRTPPACRQECAPAEPDTSPVLPASSRCMQGCRSMGAAPLRQADICVCLHGHASSPCRAGVPLSSIWYGARMLTDLAFECERACLLTLLSSASVVGGGDPECGGGAWGHAD